MKIFNLIIGLAICSGNSFAATFTVNSLAAGPAGAGNSGTLEYCINQANLSAGPHTIEFSVAGTIVLPNNGDYLPNLTSNDVTIDGTTAPGFVDAPVVIIDYTGTTNGYGLRIYGPNCELLSIEMRGAAYTSILIESTANVTIMEGCVIRDGLQYGIQVAGASGCIFENNRIGVNWAGDQCAGNGYNGMEFNSNSGGNQILNNHISCNSYDGINFDNSHNNEVYGNTIGPLSSTCTSNGYSGVDIRYGSTSNIIGGTNPGEANKISGNLYWGVAVRDAGTVGNIISGNSITCNDYNGIGISNGGNNNVAQPVISSANATTISGTSVANAEIEVFRAQDPTVFGCPGTPANQGVDYFGAATADGAGNWSLTGSFDGYVVATQRTNDGTSQFSAQVNTGVSPNWINSCDGLISGPPIVTPTADFTASADSICAGDCVDFTDLSANNPDTWNWTFAGSATSASTDQDPIGICYNSAGTFQVELIASNAAGSDTYTQDIVVIALPVVNITQNVDVLNATQGLASYQWLLNGSPLAGETDDSLVVTSNGNYEVIVTNAFGCVDTSTVFVVDNLGVSNPLLELNASIYPNPTSGNIHVEIQDLSEDINIVVKDQLGRIVLTQELSSNKSMIELGRVADGTYFVTFGYKEWQVVKKIQLLR